MRYVLLFVLTILSNVLMAQRGISPTEGAKSLAMSGASVVNDDISSIFNNQAGLAHLDTMAVIVQANRRYNLSDLTGIGAGFGTATRFGNVGIQVSSYGFESLSEQKIGLAYARKLTDIVSLGAQFDFIQFKLEGFGSQISTTFEVGLYSILSDQLHLAAHVFSPAKVSITEEYSLDSRLRVGLKYMPSKKVELQAEVDKTVDLLTSFRVGFQYQLGQKTVSTIRDKYKPYNVQRRVWVRCQRTIKNQRWVFTPSTTG